MSRSQKLRDEFTRKYDDRSCVVRDYFEYGRDLVRLGDLAEVAPVFITLQGRARTGAEETDE